MSINVTAMGVVELLRVTEDGNWRTTIAPGEWERAEELLNKEELAEVQTSWTDTVINARAEMMAEIDAEVGSQPSAVDEVAELRAMVVELKAEVMAMKGSKER